MGERSSEDGTVILTVEVSREDHARLRESRSAWAEIENRARARLGPLRRQRFLALAVAVLLALFVFAFRLEQRLGFWTLSPSLVFVGVCFVRWQTHEMESASAEAMHRARQAYTQALSQVMRRDEPFILLLRNFDSEHPISEFTAHGELTLPSGARFSPLMERLHATMPIISLFNGRDIFPQWHSGLRVVFDDADWFRGFKGLARHAGLVLGHIASLDESVRDELDWLAASDLLRKTVCLATPDVASLIVSRYGDAAANGPAIIELCRIHRRIFEGDVPAMMPVILERAASPNRRRHFALIGDPLFDQDEVAYFTLLALDTLSTVPEREGLVSVVTLWSDPPSPLKKAVMAYAEAHSCHTRPKSSCCHIDGSRRTNPIPQV